MFTRASRPARIDTLIGKAARVHGDVEFQGGLHLDGHIAGGVRSDRKSTRLNSSHGYISYAVFCLKKQMPSMSANRAGAPSATAASGSGSAASGSYSAWISSTASRAA